MGKSMVAVLEGGQVVGTLLNVVSVSLARRVEVRNLNATHLSGLGLPNLRSTNGGRSNLFVNGSRACSHLRGTHVGVVTSVLGLVLVGHGVREAVRSVSLVLGGLEVLNGLSLFHHSKNFGEALSVLLSYRVNMGVLTYFGNALVGFSEGHLLPRHVVRLLSEQVHYALVAGSTGDGAEGFSGEHSVILVVFLTHIGGHHEVVQIFNLVEIKSEALII